MAKVKLASRKNQFSIFKSQSGNNFLVTAENPDEIEGVLAEQIINALDANGFSGYDDPFSPDEGPFEGKFMSRLS